MNMDEMIAVFSIANCCISTAAYLCQGTTLCCVLENVQEISGGSAGDSKMEVMKVGISWCIFSQHKTKETENVMQPLNSFSMNTSLIRSQILKYTKYIHF